MEEISIKLKEGKTTTSIIEVKGLTKVFNNEVRAVDSISFSVEEGEILGFLGPNGAVSWRLCDAIASSNKPEDSK